MFDRPYCLIDTLDAWQGFDSLADLALAIHALRAGRGLDVDDRVACWGEAETEMRPSIGLWVKDRAGQPLLNRVILTPGEKAADLLAALAATRPARKVA